MRKKSLLTLIIIFLLHLLRFTNGNALVGVCFFTTNPNFSGSNLKVQKLSPEDYDQFMCENENDYLKTPQNLSSGFEFLGMLYGNCDIKLNCNKKMCVRSPKTKKGSTIEIPPVTHSSSTVETTSVAPTTSVVSEFETGPTEAPTTKINTELLTKPTPRVALNDSFETPPAVTITSSTIETTPIKPKTTKNIKAYLPVSRSTTTRTPWTGTYKQFDRANFTYHYTFNHGGNTATWKARSRSTTRGTPSPRYVNDLDDSSYAKDLLPPN